MLPSDAVVIEETLSSAPGIRSLIRSDDPQSFFGLRGGGIGWGLPAAIGPSSRCRTGRCRAHRRRQRHVHHPGAVTAAHYRIPVVFVILNNTSYRILKQRLHALRGTPSRWTPMWHGAHRSGDRFRGFVALARRRGRTRQDGARATDLVAKGIASDAPLLIDVELDRAFKPM